VSIGDEQQDVFVDYKTQIQYTKSLLDRGKLRCLDDRKKVLSNQQIEDFLVYTSTTRNPERNRVIVLLSVKAGLRAGEIAKQM
jgi:integrase